MHSFVRNFPKYVSQTMHMIHIIIVQARDDKIMGDRKAR
jgi:hypothetical protein